MMMMEDMQEKGSFALTIMPFRDNGVRSSRSLVRTPQTRAQAQPKNR